MLIRRASLVESPHARRVRVVCVGGRAAPNNSTYNDTHITNDSHNTHDKQLILIINTCVVDLVYHVLNNQESTQIRTENRK